MSDIQSKHVVLEFLKSHTLAVIATSSQDGAPQAAVIDFSVRDNLEIVFDTFGHTRKFANLAASDRVAFVIGWDDNITVQYEGIAERVPDADIAAYQHDHLERVPFEREFIEKGAIIFRVAPRWIRYSDFSKEPPEIVEIDF